MQKTPKEKAKNDISKVLHVFRFDLDCVWEFMKNSADFNTFYYDSECKVEFTKGISLFEKDAEYTITNKSSLKLTFTVLDVEDTRNFKRLRLLVEFPCERIHVEFLFERISLDCSTFLKWEVWPEKSENESNTLSPYLKMFEEESPKLLKRMDDCFTQHKTKTTEQCESALLQCNVNIAWKVITNWSIFQKLVPCICDEIEYEGSATQLDTVLILKWNVKREATCKLKVIKCDFENKKNIEYRLLCIEGKPKVPLQEIHFRFLDVQNQHCFFQFKHIYLEPVHPKLLEGISEYKLKILKSLQKNINKLLKALKEPSASK